MCTETSLAYFLKGLNRRARLDISLLEERTCRKCGLAEVLDN
jgi:hypothetical protein